jgi:hypothetical protein
LERILPDDSVGIAATQTEVTVADDSVGIPAQLSPSISLVYYGLQQARECGDRSWLSMEIHRRSAAAARHPWWVGPLVQGLRSKYDGLSLGIPFAEVWTATVEHYGSDCSGADAPLHGLTTIQR